MPTKFVTEILLNTVAGVIQKFTWPLKCRRRRTLPWINDDVCQLMKKRDQALKTSLFTKLHTDIFNYKGLRKRVEKGKDKLLHTINR